MTNYKSAILFAAFSVLCVLLFVADIAAGTVALPVADVVKALTGGDCPEAVAKIVINLRLVKAVVAILVGISLSVSGLQMQTLFRNPLAGPYVLGVSSGASLAVAIYLLGAPALGLSGSVASISMAGAAWIGAGAILLLITAVGRRFKDIMVILILGMMISSGISAVVQILQYLSAEDSLKSFIIWTMGSLGNVTLVQLPIFAVATLLGLVMAVLAVKPLNVLLLGDEYARTMGLDLQHSRTMIFLSTVLLAGTATAFCGPIGFIGLALPHLARAIFATADHRILVPASAIIGCATMLACDIISKTLTLPVNAITALIGIPIVIWIVVRNKSIAL